jgi:hypothetical protein
MSNMKITKMKLSLILLVAATAAQAQLAVTVSPVKVAGQKVIVPLALTNQFNERIESARAAVFLLDKEGKMVGQSTRWVIGGSADKPGLAAGATNAFNFVLTAIKPIKTTNLNARVIFSRVILEGGKLADVHKAAEVRN